MKGKAQIESQAQATGTRQRGGHRQSDGIKKGGHRQIEKCLHREKEKDVEIRNRKERR